MQYKGIIFDLDGTLINSLEDIADSMNRVLKNHRLPVHDTESYRFYIGEGIENLIKNALPASERTPALIQSYLLEYRSIYKDHCLDTTRPYPGIEGLLSELWRRNVATAVLSNKSDKFTRYMTDEIFPENRFIIVRGAFEEIPIKPHPAGAQIIADKMGLSSETVIFTGDSAVDIETGKNAGMTSLGVTWGIRPERELVDAGASRLISEPAEILDYFRWMLQ